jgi:hypothetical protein
MKRSALLLALVLLGAPGSALAAHGGGGGHGGFGGGHGWGGGGWHGGGWHGGHHHGNDFVFGFGFAPWYWDPFYFPYAYSYPYYGYPPYGYGYPPPPEDAGPPPEAQAPPPDQQQDAWNNQQQDTGDPMDASYGLVKLRGVPDGASVELDGRYWLTAARLSERWLALPRGRHTLTIRPQQGAASEHTVDVKPGVNVVIDFHLRG